MFSKYFHILITESRTEYRQQTECRHRNFSCRHLVQKRTECRQRTECRHKYDSNLIIDCKAPHTATRGFRVRRFKVHEDAVRASVSVQFLHQVGVDSLCLPREKSISTGNPPAVLQQSVHSEELDEEEVGRCLESAIDDKVGGGGEGFKGVFSSKDEGASAE